MTRPSPLVTLSRKLSAKVDALAFAPPVACVYNPLDYARAPAELYLERYGVGPKEALFVGMNPGPFGMTQTGVPFGDIAMVRDFLRIDAAVRRPSIEHAKRPIEGFACARSEVSGTRLWGWVKDRFVTPEAFFERFFVWNYCPLVFLEQTGANRTPDKLAPAERAALFAVCDETLAAVARTLDVKLVIGVGAFATGRAKLALGETGPRFGTMLHPSPASPRANRGWAAQAEADLAALDVRLP